MVSIVLEVADLSVASASELKQEGDKAPSRSRGNKRPQAACNARDSL